MMGAHCIDCYQECGEVTGTSGVLNFCENVACSRYGLLTVFTLGPEDARKRRARNIGARCAPAAVQSLAPVLPTKEGTQGQPALNRKVEDFLE